MHTYPIIRRDTNHGGVGEYIVLYRITVVFVENCLELYASPLLVSAGKNFKLK
jgi:hypothetical protein